MPPPPPFSPQAALYEWIKATGTIKLHPYDPLLQKARQTTDYVNLNNKVGGWAGEWGSCG